MPNIQTQSTFSVYPWTNEGHTHHIRMNQSDELSIIVSDTSFVTHLHIATIVLIYIHVAPWLMHIPRSTNSIQCSQLISDTLFFSRPTLHFYTIMIVSYISFLDFPRLLHLPPVRTNCRLTAPTQPVEVYCWILLNHKDTCYISIAITHMSA